TNWILFEYIFMVVIECKLNTSLTRFRFEEVEVMARQIDSIYGRSSSVSSRQLDITRFINRTYGWMFLGLLVTAWVSFAIASSETALRFILENRAVFYGALIAEVVLVMGLSASFARLSAQTAVAGFIAYSALNGVTLSLIFMMY